MKSKYTHIYVQSPYVQSPYVHFEYLAVYEIMWKNMVQPDSPQMAVRYGACALDAG
jgi:hypothetical protein